VASTARRLAATIALARGDASHASEPESCVPKGRRSPIGRAPALELLIVTRLAIGDVVAAHEAADRLATVARASGPERLEACAALAEGRVAAVGMAWECWPSWWPTETAGAGASAFMSWLLLSSIRAGRAARRLSPSHQSSDGGEQLIGLVLLLFAFGDAYAGAGVVIEQAQRDFVQGGLDGTDLCEDVDAVAVVFDHALHAAHLAFDAP